MHEKYSKEPATIDWSSYKEFFDNHPTIAKLQEDYEATASVTLPEPEVSELSTGASAVSSTNPLLFFFSLLER